jgi:hypothetical protein
MDDMGNRNFLPGRRLRSLISSSPVAGGHPNPLRDHLSTSHPLVRVILFFWFFAESGERAS